MGGPSSLPADQETVDLHRCHSQVQHVKIFSSRQYATKSDVFDYHAVHRRGYRVDVSNKRRYKAICVVSECEFVVQFAFLRQFEPSSLFREHTCSTLHLGGSIRASNRALHAKQIARKPEVRELFIAYERYVSPKMTQSVMLKFDGNATYKNCLNAKKRLMIEFFGHELEQYRCLPRYLQQLKERHHRCDIDIQDGIFARLVIVFHEGVQAFEQYACQRLCGIVTRENEDCRSKVAPCPAHIQATYQRAAETRLDVRPNQCR